MGEHTPGPWVVDGRDVRAKNSGSLTVAVMCSGDRAGAEGTFSISRDAIYPNARLIAAAPDLLAVLQSLMPSPLIGESYDPPVPSDELLKEFFFTWGKLRAARAAISKATEG